MTAAVQLFEARKSFGGVEALRGVDLRIEQGDVVAMLGPNGAGKTTSIGLMLGLRRPTSGRAELFGRDPTDLRARSRCGAMLQESGVGAVLRVRELVDLFRSYYPRPMPAERAIRMAGLEEVQQQASGRLSGGQRQRLYFALAVCGDPDLLFLDEPTVGMDVEGRRAFLRSIREFAAEGKTIVLTTHYLEEADELARRVVVIDHGVVIADAPPAEIKARAAGKRVSFAVPGGPLQGALEGLPITSLEVSGDRVRLLTARPEEVLMTLFARGLAVTDLEVVGADLEEAFIALTGREEGGA